MHDEENPLTTFGARLKFAREKRNFTREALGERAGRTHKMTIQDYETGRIKKASFEKLQLLAAALRVSVDWLTDGTRENFPGTEPPPQLAPATVRGLDQLLMLAGEDDVRFLQETCQLLLATPHDARDMLRTFLALYNVGTAEKRKAALAALF